MVEARFGELPCDAELAGDFCCGGCCTGAGGLSDRGDSLFDLLVVLLRLLRLKLVGALFLLLFVGGG